MDRMGLSSILPVNYTVPISTIDLLNNNSESNEQAIKTKRVNKPLSHNNYNIATKCYIMCHRNKYQWIIWLNVLKLPTVAKLTE